MNTWSAINYHLMNELSYDRDYSLDELYVIYQRIMNRDVFCTVKVVKRESFRDRLNTWCDADNGIAKEGSGKQVTYRKLEPVVNCPYLLLTEKLKEAMARLWKR